MILGTYQQASGDPLMVSDFMKPQLEEQEKMLSENGLTGTNYSKVSQFAAANNSRTGPMRPGTLGIYYASMDDVASFQFLDSSKVKPGTFIVGGWGSYYPNAEAASSALNKKVTFAVIFYKANGGGFVPINAIQIGSGGTSSKPSSTLTNKND